MVGSSKNRTISYGLFDLDDLMLCFQKTKYKRPLTVKHILQETAPPQFQRKLIFNSCWLLFDGRNKSFDVSCLFDFFLILIFGLILNSVQQCIIKICNAHLVTF